MQIADPRSAAPETRKQLTAAMWAMAGPTLLLNGLQVANNLIDAGLIGHLPKAAMTAHGAALNQVFLMFSTAMAVSMAATALVSRAFGAGEVSEYRTAARQCLSLSFLLGIVLAVIGVGLATPMSKVFVPSDNPAAQSEFVKFLTVFCIGIPGTAVITTLASCMRGIGDAKSPTVISGAQIILHLAMSVFLIFPTGYRFPLFAGYELVVPIGAGLGLSGGAAGMSISAVLSAVAYVLYASRTPLGNVFSLRLPSREWVVRILNIAVPAMAQSILRVLSFSAFTIMVKGTPTADAALAALRLGIALESIMFMPAFGFSMAAGALVGQSLGAKNPDRATRIGWLASHNAAYIIFGLSVPIFVFAPQIAGMLTNFSQPDVVREATHYIRILIATEVLFGYAMVLSGAVQGAGDTRAMLVLTILALWVIRVPLAYILMLPQLNLGSTGAWIAMSVSQAIQGFMLMAFWKRGSWKTVKV